MKTAIHPISISPWNRSRLLALGKSVLEEIGVVIVEETVEMKATDRTTGTQSYAWHDFPLGVLKIEVVECLGPDKNPYRCIGRVVLVNE